MLQHHSRLYTLCRLPASMRCSVPSPSLPAQYLEAQKKVSAAKVDANFRKVGHLGC